MDEYDESSLVFTDRVIKGKIAEVVFRQLMTHNKNFDVIPIGYEYKFPELLAHVQKPHREIIEKVSAQLRHAPDFLLLSKNHDQIFLVEVKYHTQINEKLLLQEAKTVNEKWDYAWLFVASPEGFFFSSCREIVENLGVITPLGEKWPSISPQVMQRYLQILNQYIGPSDRPEAIDVYRYSPS